MWGRMLRFFTGAWDLWGILLWGFPSVGSLMTAVLAYAQEVQWHLIIFYSSGVAAFFAVLIYLIQESIRKNSIYGYLRLAKLGLKAIMGKNEKKTVSLRLNFAIGNVSIERTVYTKVSKVYFTLQGKINTKEFKEMHTILLPPNSDQGVHTALIPGIDFTQNIEGKLEVETLYGKNEEELNHKMIYEAVINVIPLKVTNDGKRSFNLNTTITKYEQIRNI